MPRTIFEETIEAAITALPDLGAATGTEKVVTARGTDLFLAPSGAIAPVTVADNDALPTAAAGLVGRRYLITNINATGFPALVECLPDGAGGYLWVRV